MAFYIDRFGNKIEVGAAGGEVYFVSDVNELLPTAATSSQGFVTDDGTQSGNITASYIKAATGWVKTGGTTPISATVVDNTIKISTNITEIGRYIVPDSDTLDSEFESHRKQYADWDGASFIYTTPDSDDSVVITSGPNAGRIWKYAFGKWEDTQTKTDYPFYAWAITAEYKVGDIVIYNNRFYQANSNIAKNIAFTVGTTANTWKSVGDSSMVVENGQVRSTTGSNLTLNTAWQTVPNITFTAVTSGTYEVNALVPRGGSVSRVALTLAINGVAQESLLQHFGYNSVEDGMTPTFVTSLTSGQVVTVVAKGLDGGGVIFNDSGSGNYERRPSMRWKKISGFVPATGAVTAILKATRTTPQSSLSVGTTLICDSVSTSTGSGISYNIATGVVTLAAGNTYRLRGAVAGITQNVSQASVAYRWYNTTAAAYVGELGGNVSPAATNNAGVVNGAAETIITPSVTTQISLRFTAVNNVSSVGIAGNAIEGGYPWIEVEQLGTTNTSAFTGVAMSDWNIANSYASGTVVVYNKTLYQANAFIAAGTAFATGTTGSTWTALQTGTGYVMESATISIPNQTMPASSGASGIWSDVTGGTFTLPSAGTYEINYTIQAGEAGQWSSFGLFNSLGNFVNGSGSHGTASGADGLMQFNQSFIVTVTGATPYTLKSKSYNGAQVVIAQGEPSSTLFATNQYGGSSQITYKKIGGAIPVTGSTTSYAAAVKTANQTLPGSSTNVTFESVAGSISQTAGAFTLPAGGTYELSAGVTTTEVDRSTFQWYNITTGTWIGGPSTNYSPTNGAINRSPMSGVASAIITASTSVEVALRSRINTSTVISIGDFITTDVRAWANIKQLGTTSTAQFTGVLSNNWNIINSYPSGTIVTKDNLMYQANASIPTGTAFIEGTSGATWRLMNYAVASEYVESNDGVTTSVGLTDVFVKAASITIPSSGKWDVTGRAFIAHNGGASSYEWRVNGTTVASGNTAGGSTSLGNTYLSGGLETVWVEALYMDASLNAYDIVELYVNEVNSAVDLRGDANPPKIYARKVAGFCGLTKKVFTEQVTIGATTTAPTKPTTREKDYITLIDDNTGWCDVMMDLYYSSATGGTTGSGTYLFSLPAGYAFDSYAHPFLGDTGIQADTWPKRLPAISSTYPVDGTVVRTSDGSQNRIAVVAHSATQFKMMLPDQSYNYMTSANYQITGGPQRIAVQFKFKKA